MHLLYVEYFESSESYFYSFFGLWVLLCIWVMVPTVCPRSSDQFYVVTYYIKWVTTSWTHSITCPPDDATTARRENMTAHTFLQSQPITQPRGRVAAMVLI